MQVARFMTRHPITIGPDAPLEEAIALMEEHGFRHLPVEQGGELVGMLSDRSVHLGTGGSSLARLGLDKDEGQQTVADVMRSTLACVESDDRGAVAAKRMVEHRIGALPVLDGGRLVGIVTETNLIRAFRDLCRDPGQADKIDATAEEVMHTSPITLSPDDSVQDALERCTDWRVRHIPVMEDDELVGMVSDRDIRMAAGRALVAGNASGGADVAKIRDLMSTEIESIDPRDLLSIAVAVMLPSKVTALPVMIDGMLMGIVTRADILEHYGNVA